nr:hypothetical protein GCM10025732_46950 [Glycomyces mayteni]
MDEAMPEYARARSYGWCDPLVLQSASSAAQLDAAGITVLNEYYTDTAAVAALLTSLGAGALPIIERTFSQNGHLHAEFRKTLYRAVAALPSDAAMDLLVKRLHEPHVFEPAAEAAARFPQRTLRTVLARAGRTSGDARFRLIALASLVPEADRAFLDEAGRAALDALLAENGRAPEADLADVPALLATPPWTVKRAKAKSVVIEGLEAPEGTAILWAPGEREEWAGLKEYWDDEDADEPGPDAHDWQIEQYLVFGDPAKAEKYLDKWIAKDYYGYEYSVLRVLARYGDRTAERAVAAARRDATFQRLPGPILGLDAARLAAERFDRLKSARPSAAKWFARHGLAAVPYLVPDALGADKKLRRYAETALLHLAMRFGAAETAAASERFGPEAAQAIAALLDGDPLEPRGVKLPKPGAWASPATLPQVLLKDGRALPAESVRHLLTVLALATPEYPYPGLDVVADACDRASLARFGRAVFQLWLSIGAPPRTPGP